MNLKMDLMITKGDYTLKSQKLVLTFMISTHSRKLSDPTPVTFQSIPLPVFKAMGIGNE